MGKQRNGLLNARYHTGSDIQRYLPTLPDCATMVMTHERIAVVRICPVATPIDARLNVSYWRDKASTSALGSQNTGRPMDQCDLDPLYGAIVDAFPSEAISSGAYTDFTAHTLPAAPKTLKTDRLIVKKSRHGYGGSYRVDLVQMYASQRTFRLLGVWMLSVVFHPNIRRSQLALTHNGSDIVRIICKSCSGNPWEQGIFGFSSLPSQFRYMRSPLSRHPFAESRPEVADLPLVALTNAIDMIVTEDDYQNRDTIIGFGTSRGTVRFAALLMDLGDPENSGQEVDLECECGFRGVTSGSAEVHLVTPPTERWVAIAPDYPEFGKV
jgi:hypothetical protein